MNATTFTKAIQFLKAQTKTWLCTLAVSLCLISLTFAQQPGKAPASRTWTSLTGHKITAAFVAIEGENIVLKYEDGQERKIRLPMLIEADQALAKELDKLPKGDAQTKGSASNRLPIFISGKAKGNHAIYSHDNFIAKITASGAIEIQCLEDGSPVGKPLLFSFRHDYYKGDKRYTRRLTEFHKFPLPSLSPTLLEYEAALEEDVTTGVNVAFIDNTIQVWGWVIDPPQIKESTFIRLNFSFRASHVFPPEKTVAEQKKILEPYTLAVYEKKKGLTRFPYGDAVFRLPRTAQRMIVEGPLFGKRSISVSAQSQKNTALDIVNYRDYAPYQGYTVRMMKDKQSSKSDSERMILTID